MSNLNCRNERSPIGGDPATEGGSELAPGLRQKPQDARNARNPADDIGSAEIAPGAAPVASGGCVIAYDAARDLFVARGADGAEIAAGATYYEADVGALAAAAAESACAEPTLDRRQPFVGAAIEAAVARIEQAAALGWITAEQRRRLLRALT